MKLTVDREQLSNVMTIITSVVNPRHANPLIQNVMLDATKDGLTLRATDLEVSLQQSVEDAGVEKPGKALVSATRLAVVLKDLRAERVKLETHKEMLAVHAERDKVQLQGAEADSFPGFPTFEKKNSLTLPAGGFKWCLSRTGKAIAADKGRYALNGVYIKPHKDYVEFCGTDGRRLSYAKLAAKVKPIDSLIIIPRRGVDLLERAAERLDDGTLALDVRENEIVANVGAATVSTQLVEGQYPDFWSVIPKSNDKKLVVNRAEFLSRLKLVQHTTGPESQTVTISIAKNEMTLKTQAFGAGNSEAVVAVTYDGPSTKIGFDPRYLVDCLSTMEKDDVIFEFRDSDTGAIFHEGDKDNFFYVVMPLEVE